MAKRKKAGGVSRLNFRPVVTCEESWLLLQDAADLLDEVHRLVSKAAEYDEAFQKSRRYKALLKRLNSMSR